MADRAEPILPGRIPGAGGINTYNEKPLHAALKHWIASPDDRMEAVVDGYVVDVVRGDDLLIEVQTSNAGAIRAKLIDLCSRHPVRLVLPIAAEKWIVTRAAPEGGGGAACDRPAGDQASKAKAKTTRTRTRADKTEGETRRKSPKRGRVEDLFEELVHLPGGLMKHENFSLEVLLIREEEVRRPAPPRGRWRKGWIREERRLLEVIERRVFRTPSDLEILLPLDLPDPFTARELADRTGAKHRLAQKAVYTLCGMDVLSACGRRGRARLYERGSAATHRLILR